MTILSLIRSVLDRRISPASDRLSAQFRRRGVPPPRLNRPAWRVCPLSAMATARSLDVEIYEGISDKFLPCRCFGPWSLDRVRVFAWFFPARPLRSPTHGQGHLPGCVDGCIWGIDGTPRFFMPLRLSWELLSVRKKKKSKDVGKQHFYPLTDTVKANVLTALTAKTQGLLRKNPVLPETPENILESIVFSSIFVFFSIFYSFPSPIYRKLWLNCRTSIF